MYDWNVYLLWEKNMAMDVNLHKRNKKLKEYKLEMMNLTRISIIQTRLYLDVFE